MKEQPIVIIGGGMSGLAAAIRLARFGKPTVILEKHTRPGGLNSYYHRQGHLFETGLHAMTNYAGPKDRSAPLNRLFRQLKLSRKTFRTHEQIGSEIRFPTKSLHFSNDFSCLHNEVCTNFPASAAGFTQLTDFIKHYDPFLKRPWLSARQRLRSFIPDPLLIEMLLCPLMIYGNSEEDDMDLAQFVIMFQAVFLEGFFRPAGSIRDFLEMLQDHYLALGGEIRYRTGVESLLVRKGTVLGVRLATGEEIEAQTVLSTIGAVGTMALLPDCLPGVRNDYVGRLSFVESIYLLPQSTLTDIQHDATCIFYSDRDTFLYRRPAEPIDIGVGVINFPANFQELEPRDPIQIRVTHPANYESFRLADQTSVNGRSSQYLAMKKSWQELSLAKIGKMIGNFSQNIVYLDTFTPLSIEHYSGKAAGAVYGSPLKIKDGLTRYRNLLLAGTDQGFLGIVGAMLSGVTIVNQQLLTVTDQDTA
ncbi:MAG: FAD-dependent oxidoreductase [Desulfobulbaceae bacterium]|nr:FAD-dependent oxidoreductase [Desulfobulbaceae bacterium]